MVIYWICFYGIILIGIVQQSLRGPVRIKGRPIGRHFMSFAPFMPHKGIGKGRSY